MYSFPANALSPGSLCAVPSVWAGPSQPGLLTGGGGVLDSGLEMPCAHCVFKLQVGQDTCLPTIWEGVDSLGRREEGRTGQAAQKPCLPTTCSPSSLQTYTPS